MSQIKIAKRYAKAALDEAKEKNLIDIFSMDFNLILKTIKESKDLRLLFRSPVIRRALKFSIIDQIFKPKINSETLNFLHFLIEKGRDVITHEILESFFQIKNDYYGIIETKVTGYRPLSDPQLNKIKINLEKLTNKKINIDFKVNKDLMGGALIQIGDTVFDGSVKRKLELLKDHLTKPI